MNYQIHQLKSNSSEIYLLEFDVLFNPQDHLDSLTDSEIEKYYSFKSDKRKKEFVATRILKHSIFGYQEIKYKEHGAPYIDNVGFISISHANKLVGLAINPHHHIGFDIEEIHDKVQKVKHKFLNEKEQKFINFDDTEQLIKCWSTKEAMYKLAGRKLIDFKKELLFEKIEENKILATIKNSDHNIRTEIVSLKHKNFILTINCKSPIVEYANDSF